MKTQLLNSSDQAWNECLARFDRNNQHIHFTSAYHRMMERNGDGQAKCLVIEDNKSLFFYPFMFNALSGIGRKKLDKTYHYITSVYGYTGPFFINTNPGFEKEVKDELKTFFGDHNVLFEFVRFNPFINNAATYNENFGIRIVNEKQYVYVKLEKEYALAHARYTQSLKNNINKARNQNLHVSMTRDEAWVLDEIYALYRAHMIALKTGSYYLFSDNYYSSLNDLISENGHAFYVRHDGKIIAATIFLFHNNTVYSHHTTRDLNNTLSGLANKLMIDEAIKFYGSQDFTYILLGGGVSNDEKDSLLEFKKSYSKEYFHLVLGKHIVNETAYKRSEEIWKAEYPELTEKYAKYIDKLVKVQ
jgi:serine/alanine adding enzyme